MPWMGYAGLCNPAEQDDCDCPYDGENGGHRGMPEAIERRQVSDLGVQGADTYPRSSVQASRLLREQVRRGGHRHDKMLERTCLGGMPLVERSDQGMFLSIEKGTS